MRSDGPPADALPAPVAADAEPPGGRAPRLAWLRSQGLGILCGQATVLLLGAGTLVQAHVEGVPAPQADDVRVFFTSPSPWHAWFYLLLFVLGLYALNTALCTWDSVVRRVRLGQRTLSAYAPSVMHVAFLVALVAHGVGGLWSREEAPVELGPDWRDLGGGRQARVTGLDEETHPDGSLRQARATVEVREGAAGAVRREAVRFNGPLSFGLGTDLFLLADWGEETSAVRLSSGGTSCRAAPGARCDLGGRSLAVMEVRMSGHWGPLPVVFLGVDGRRVFAPLGQDTALADGTAIRFEGVDRSPAVLLRHRHAPGNPWALGAAALLGLGCLMMGRRWL